MKLLVVTPTLGESRWLDATVESVSTCAMGALHVLVSPAGRISELSAAYPSVRVVEETGAGMYAAINTGLRAEAQWDAFTYLNDDDVLLPAFAQVIRTLESRRAEPAAAYGGVRLIGADGRRRGRIPTSPDPAMNRWLYAQRIEPVYQHGTVFTRGVFERLGGFDESFRFCGDSEYLARACLAGIPFLCATRGDVAAFRLRPGQLTKARPSMIAERERVDAKLKLLEQAPGPSTLRLARWRFRWANAAIYAERILRHGFVSMDQVFTRE